MLEENAREKARKNADCERERVEDIEAQANHAAMLDKQQADRENEFSMRERRAQEFMNRMASTVIVQQNMKQKQEDDNIHKYEVEREMRMRLEDEKRLELILQRKSDMRSYLNKQMGEKKDREHREKKLNDEQAVMWMKDKQIHEQEEVRLTDKIKGINLQNAEFLNRQMDDKKLRTKGGMNKTENQYNKPLLKVINDKRKEAE